MTLIYALRHAQTKLNGFSAVALTILGRRLNINQIPEICRARHSDLKELFFEHTAFRLPKSITHEQLETWQNELTPRGIAQAKTVGEYLSALHIHPYFVTSPSMRAIHTAFIIASTMNLSPSEISIDQPQDFLEEISKYDLNAAFFFTSSLEAYLHVSKSIIGDRALVVVSHGNILTAFHNYLLPGDPLNFYTNCSLTEAVYNPHIRIINPHRSISDLVSNS